MNLEQAKNNATEAFIELKKSLIDIYPSLYEDIQIPEEPLRMNFAGWSIVESYEFHLESQMAELVKSIRGIKIFQNASKDSHDLIKWMLSEIGVQYLSNTNYLGFSDNTFEPWMNTYKNEIVKFYEEKLAEFEGSREIYHAKVLSILEKELNDAAKPSKTKKEIAKFKWQGEQKHLVELFDILIARNWIIADPTPTANAHAILEAFDITGTKKDPDSDEEKSFVKGFLGDYIKKTGERIRPGHPLYDPKYKFHFDSIKECPKVNSEK